MTSRIAFVIPLDVTRHLEYAQNLVALIGPYSDVFVVITHHHIIEKDPHLQFITLEDFVSAETIERCEKNRTMPTFKKWAALNHLTTAATTAYSHYICMDSEIKVVKNIDAAFIDALPSQFTFVGDHLDKMTNPYFDVVLQCDRLGSTALVAANRHYDDLFTWWSGMPVYNALGLKEFLEHVGIRDLGLLSHTLKWQAFDHMVYQRYLVSKGQHGARFLCLSHDLGTPTGWSLEDAATPEAISAAESIAKVKLLWISARGRVRLPPELTKNAYILYHQDQVAP